MKKIIFLMMGLVPSFLCGVIFVNQTEHLIRVSLVNPFMYKGRVIVPYMGWETLIPKKGSDGDVAMFSGEIQDIHLGRALPGGGVSHGGSTGTLAKKVRKFFLEHPDFEISIVQVGGYPALKPSIPEIEEMLIKEHQAQVKPELKKTVPQLPAPLINLTTEYCTPFEPGIEKFQ